METANTWLADLWGVCPVDTSLLNGNWFFMGIPLMFFAIGVGIIIYWATRAFFLSMLPFMFLQVYNLIAWVMRWPMVHPLWVTFVGFAVLFVYVLFVLPKQEREAKNAHPD